MISSSARLVLSYFSTDTKESDLGKWTELDGQLSRQSVSQPPVCRPVLAHGRMLTGQSDSQRFSQFSSDCFNSRGQSWPLKSGSGGQIEIKSGGVPGQSWSKACCSMVWKKLTNWSGLKYHITKTLHSISFSDSLQLVFSVYKALGSFTQLNFRH